MNTFSKLRYIRARYTKSGVTAAGGVEIRRQTKTTNYACYYRLYVWLIHACAPGDAGTRVPLDFLSAQQRACQPLTDRI